ncbi:MAG: hypothetical protein NTX56_19635, partial [Proteobacteria bacterium]|nr:hypothetical protein [Pseudomonadota bacterium]
MMSIQKPKGMSVARFGLLLLAATMALLAHGAAPQPVNANFSQIVNNRSGQLAVWRYADNPSIYVFDFPGLAYQGRSFNRITQFTEQQTTESYPRVLTEQEMAMRLAATKRSESDFAFGHDVMVHELVQFFNFAQRDKVPLNPDETAVRDFLVAQGMMRDWRGFWQAVEPNNVILSIPQTQEKSAGQPLINSTARYAILLHEMAHAEYYTNAYYTQYCQRFWQESLSDAQREAFKTFLGKYNYATGSEALVINETQAYLMF